MPGWYDEVGSLDDFPTEQLINSLGADWSDGRPLTERVVWEVAGRLCIAEGIPLAEVTVLEPPNDPGLVPPE